jgi:uncharacterized integral membrane protein
MDRQAAGIGGAVTDEMTPTEHPGSPSTRDRRRDVVLVTVGAVAILLVWFALANLQDVSIHFWVMTSKAPLIVVIALSGVLGMALGWLVSRRKRPPAS